MGQLVVAATSTPHRLSCRRSTGSSASSTTAELAYTGARPGCPERDQRDGWRVAGTGRLSRSLSHGRCRPGTHDDRRFTVAFRLTPKEDSFYELFGVSAGHLVQAAKELTNLLAVETPEDRKVVVDRMRRPRARRRRVDPRDHAQVNSSFITPFDREDIYALASHLDDCMDLMEAAVDLIVLYQIDELPDGRRHPGRGAGPDGRADRRGHAAAALDEGPRRVLDRDQPAREPGRPGLPPAAGRSCSTVTSRPSTVLKLKDVVDGARARRRRLRDGRAHGREHRGQGVLTARGAGSLWPSSSPWRWASTTRTGFTTRRTRSRRRCRPGP